MGFLKSCIKINFKLALKPLISLLIMAAAAIIAAAAIGVNSTKAIDKNILLPFKLAVCIQEGDEFFADVFDIVAKTEEIAAYAQVVNVTEEEAYKMLNKGEINAAIIFPVNMTESVMYGLEFKPTLVIDANRPMESALIYFVADKALRIFAAAQEGVYVSMDYYDLNSSNAKYSRDEFIFAVNVAYITWFLNRGDIYRVIEINGKAGFSGTEEYIFIWSIFFLTLCVPALYPVLSMQNKQSWLARIKSAGYGIKTYGAAQIFTVSIIMFLYTCIIFSFVAILTKLNMAIWNNFKVLIFMYLLALALSCYAWILCNFGSIVVSSVLGMVISVSLLFLAGGIVPSVFLPFSLEKAKKFNPLSQFALSLQKIAAGENLTEAYLAVLKITVFFIAVFIAMVVYKNKKMGRTKALSSS